MTVLDACDGRRRTAAAEAMFAGGDEASARRLLAEARRHLDIRCGHMSDAGMRATFLANREENRRLIELERAWGLGG